MTFRSAATFVTGQRIRLIAPNSLDLLALDHGSLIDASSYADGARLTAGEGGIDPGKFKTATGMLGLHHVFVYAGLPGKLHENTSLPQQIASDALRDNIDVLVASTLQPGPDYRTAGQLTVQAAFEANGRLREEDFGATKPGRYIGVLLLHPSLRDPHSGDEPAFTWLPPQELVSSAYLPTPPTISYTKL